MGKHNASGTGRPDQPDGKHRASESTKEGRPVMGPITRDMYEGVRGHVNAPPTER